jgi:hypothetical protein
MKKRERQIIVAGARNRRTIFTELAERLVDTDDEAFAIIERCNEVLSYIGYT